MKLVLLAVNASWAHTNLAVRCLRERLEKDGHEVVICEFQIHDRTSEILERLVGEAGDVYGFSCYLWNLEVMLSLGEDLKRLLPKARLILGGPEVSYATDRFDKFEWIDFLVSGEGEEALAGICQELHAGRIPPRVVAQKQTLTPISGKGIFYRDGEVHGGMLYYESSRGCPFSCAYCLSSATTGIRQKSVEETLADLLSFERLVGEFSIVKLVDRTFNASPRRANAIWQALLSEQFTKRYQFEINAALLDEESFSILSRFPRGKVQLEIGLQSTNPETLACVARQVDPGQVLTAVRRLKEFGNLHLHLDLIAGLPYESYERFGRSFDDAYGVADQLQLGFLKLLHGTPLRERMEELGYICSSRPPYTVLQSRWMSYDEICRLHRIADALERVAESGRFVHTLWYLNSRMPSPFAFWQGFAEHLATIDSRPIQRRSQPDVFRALLSYAEKLPGVDPKALRQMLAADFSEHENKRPPAFLRE